MTGYPGRWLAGWLTGSPPRTSCARLAPCSRDGLRSELRLLREDVHRITLELKERLLRVDKLRSKFDTISSKARGAGDDEDAEEHSQVSARRADGCVHACRPPPGQQGGALACLRAVQLVWERASAGTREGPV